jgi:hypothetical protein
VTQDAGVRRSVTGPNGPAVGTPDRRPRSVRRTTTHDSVRHDGMQGPVTITAIGRDLYTGAAGSATVLASARVDAVADFPGNVLSSISADPADDRLRALAGTRASSGFRSRVEQALPGERESGSVYYQILDDLPTALLVSGYAVLASFHASGSWPGARPRQRAVPSGGPGGVPSGKALQQVDMCAGWVDGGVLVAGLTEGIPPYFAGPAAPDLATRDPLGWHSVQTSLPSSMRRRRRVDVWPDGDRYLVESFFRDSYFSPDGAETVIHEYTVRASVDGKSGSFGACDAEYGALPWPECPAATASAGRLVGTPAAGLRSRVRAEFTGISTCTHLNDTLRALADVGALIGALESQP